MTAISLATGGTQGTGTGAGRSVSVNHGDTLSAIARRLGISLDALIAANPQLINPNRIYPGDVISVPGGMGGGKPSTGAGGSTPTGSAHGAAPGQGGAHPAGMSLSSGGLDLIKSHEGLRTSAYQDPVGVWTIGYGHTGTAKPGQKISEAQAEQLLRKDVGWAEDAVRKNVKVPLSQGQFDALVSFTFNLGAGALGRSGLLQKLNAGDYAGAQAEFGKYVHAGGRVLPGLVRRRNEEAQMFGNQRPPGNGAGPSGPNGSSAPNGADYAGTGRARQGSYTVKSGDTLWAIARAHGVSLQSLIAANPQIANPDLIYPDQKINIPGGGARPGERSNGPGVVGPATPTPVGNGAGARTAQIAESFLERNASELKKSGELPMNPNVPNNVCCANFVSAVLEKNGLLSKGEHTDSVAQLHKTLRGKGWKPVDMANAKPGDVVIMQRNGVSHTEIVAKNENGKITLVGSNNRNTDGSQRITYDSNSWWHNKVSAILTPP
ncbi:SafA/ExsA family spore coat assembly protein [Ottowia sp. GY511]|uniref:Lysozyme n=1 Tax=Ottowia flava TaxID=2675430 RepID=A0ABW4KXJ0_9BURK|nr:SafA/ExsA family spore coat assembly protein [Ottowia sp. GY511]TXK23296.1 SafA/ExsA family spore coat assembly protein [Ottowia sp. GY511]